MLTYFRLENTAYGDRDPSRNKILIHIQRLIEFTETSLISFSLLPVFLKGNQRRKQDPLNVYLFIVSLYAYLKSLTCWICTKSVDFLDIHTLKFCTELPDKPVSIFFLIKYQYLSVYLYYYTLVHSTLPECVNKSSGPFVFWRHP